jgi:hypothetical protein
VRLLAQVWRAAAPGSVKLSRSVRTFDNTSTVRSFVWPGRPAL